MAEMLTMQNFLLGRDDARDLDKNEFKRSFPQGVRKADFLLFGDSVVCEAKEIKKIQIESKVERLWKEGALPEEVLKREVLSAITSVLEEADAQIVSTKKFLKLKDAFGLVIVETLMPNVVTGPHAFCRRG
jgi:hypothetical protein